ncbi:XopAD/skwp family type III secretion system effector [Bradyrhizobium uaiense]|nr:XopAD/skwp family type III secretion system effector [Bradyrhizobium uaiense]
MPELTTFLQKAATHFKDVFVPRWEDDVRRGNSWGYATTCNAVSQPAGGQAGLRACQAMAGQVSRLDRRLMKKVEPKALSLLALSFGRHPDSTTCRDATKKIARFCRDENWVLHELNSQNLSLLVNGFSKWPKEVDCRDGIVAAAREVDGRDRLSDFSPQCLSNLVNGFSKWPEETTCGQATAAIANEILGVDRLYGFNNQGLANLANAFSKWSDETACSQATVAIANEVLGPARRADRLSGFNSQGLASLVNAFSKRSDETACSRATAAIARQVCDNERLSAYSAQELANLVNGFSKWPDSPTCGRAAVAMANEIIGSDRRSDRLSTFNHQELANLVNGFSKWPGATTCGQVTAAVASEILRRRADYKDRFSGFSPQELANLANGFSKWPDNPNCGRAAAAIADEVDRSGRLSQFTPQQLANLVNAFSKWPGATTCGQATATIASEILRRRADHNDRGFTPQELANLVNGFSKWQDNSTCCRAAVAIADEVGGSGRLSQFTPQHLSNLVSGFSKWPDNPTFGQATAAIANEILGPDRLSRLNNQDLARLVAAFSKWPDDPTCGQATVAVAGKICGDNRLAGFNKQDLANLVNAFSKWPAETACGQATVAIASEILGSDRLSHFNNQELANLVNAFSKWSKEGDCREATVAIANEILDSARAGRLSSFNSQELANLLNGFSKWPEEPACYQAVVHIARGLGGGDRQFGVFTMPELSMIANALGRGVMKADESGEIAEGTPLRDRLHQLAHYFHYANDRLERTDVLNITTIFKVLAKAQLFDDLGLLAPSGLNRLTELHRLPGFAAENNLETMGNLCAALLPLARSPRKQLRWHRRQALNLLNDIQPVVEHKIEAHLKASKAGRTRGPFASRCPALSVYQVLKARGVLENFFRRPYLEGKRRDLQVRQQELQRGTKEILASTRTLIANDLSNMSWNLIAQIEAESPVDALDAFMAQDAATIRAQHPASVFDVHQVLRSMDHEPRPPQGQAGLMQLPVVDMQGRRMATEPETRYSIFHRLTSGAVPVVAVQLPGKPSAFMLARTLAVNGVPYRMDLFGGSKLKAPRPTVAEIAVRAPGEQPTTSGGKLLAIPYADTAPGTDFEQLLRAWAPFKEAYYYIQRRGFAAPPAIKGLGPHDYALEGTFSLLLAPDRPGSDEHPFKLTGPEGPIALRPHDGCGFIKASLAEHMPAVLRACHQEGPDRMLAYGEGRRSSVPATALQHYPRSEQVADEARERTRTWLESKQEQKLTSEELFRTVTAGHIDGPGAVTVPSGDECLHVTTLKSDTLSGGVLIGRAPYDKPNLRPFAAERVKSARDGDPTATFLDSCVAIQYSFNVAQKSGEKLAAEDPSLFAKGILIVVPDNMWPTNYADRGLVMSAEDVKCHSGWTNSKDRVKADTLVDCVGILQATEVFAAGSLVAVPPAEQKKLDGDFDGDTVAIVGDRPQLYEHVREFDQKEQARGLRSLKPPKSHTPAIEEDRYQFSRARQILAATLGVLGTYSTLQRAFLAQSDQARRWFAERAIFGIYEGVHHELRRDIRDLLNQERVSGQDIQDMLERASGDRQTADHPLAREVAELLVADLEAWAAMTDEQVLPETVESGSDANPILSGQLCELFPDLAEHYSAASQPRDRIEALLDHYPARIDPRPDGYNPDDLIQSANNLLSLGIKVGTDAYKSDTGARLFLKKSGELQRLLQQTPGLTSVPYLKSIAAPLNQGKFDVDATLEDLKDNPTLAASIMETSIKLAVENRILPEPYRRQPTAGDSAMKVTLTREEAVERAKIEASRAKSEEQEITTTTLNVVDSLRLADIEIKLPHFDRRLRSNGSMTDQLTGMTASSGGDSQLISNAVRHVFEVPDKDFARAVKKAILAFCGQGYSEISTTNWFRMRNPAFVGVKTVLATQGDYRFEVEFHTRESYKAKLANHDTYKELQRASSGDALDEKAERLLQRLREVCKEVAIPDGAQDIRHWAIEANIGRGASAVFGLRAAEQPRRPERSAIAGDIFAALGARPIVLVGLPAAGKSTIGSALARRLGLPFIDSDKQIEKATGISKSEIIATNGEPWFTEREAEVIAQSLEKGPAVLAIGGDSFMRNETRDLVGDKAVSIWLQTDETEIRKRLSKDKSRPSLLTDNPQKTFKEMLEKHTLYYRQADITLVPPHKRNNNKNADACVQVLHTYLCGDRAAVRGSDATSGLIKAEE